MHLCPPIQGQFQTQAKFYLLLWNSEMQAIQWPIGQFLKVKKTKILIKFQIQSESHRCRGGVRKKSLQYFKLLLGTKYSNSQSYNCSMLKHKWPDSSTVKTIQNFIFLPTHNHKNLIWGVCNRGYGHSMMS